MAGIVFGAIAPHGSSAIKELGGEEYPLFKPTEEGLKAYCKKLQEHNPDTIVILTPHGLKLEGFCSVYLTEFCKGKLEDNGGSISLNYNCDRKLARDILNNAKAKNIPVIGANYGTSSGEYSNIEMDWGIMVPLWFLEVDERNKPELVVITPTREIPLEQLVELGKVIAETAKDSGKRIALIASADQAHAHDPNGIYGFDPAAKEYDERIVDIVKNNKLNELLDLDLEWVNNAKPDSLWQMLILYGASLVVPMKGELISYQAPTYFGMLVASYDVI